MEWTVAIGVDTHKEVHVAVALDALGAQLGSWEVATTPAGYRSLLSWAQQLGVPAFAVEAPAVTGRGLFASSSVLASPFSSVSVRAARSAGVERAI